MVKNTRTKHMKESNNNGIRLIRTIYKRARCLPPESLRIDGPSLTNGFPITLPMIVCVCVRATLAHMANTISIQIYVHKFTYSHINIIFGMPKYGGLDCVVRHFIRRHNSYEVMQWMEYFRNDHHLIYMSGIFFDDTSNRWWWSASEQFNAEICALLDTRREIQSLYGWCQLAVFFFFLFIIQSWTTRVSDFSCSHMSKLWKLELCHRWRYFGKCGNNNNATHTRDTLVIVPIARWHSLRQLSYSIYAACSIQ